MDFKLLHAYLNLMFRTVLHYLRKLNPWHQDFGKARFLSNYVRDGLPPTNAEQRARRNDAGRCTACSACDHVCPLLADRIHTTFTGPMAFVLSAARAAPHFGDAGADIKLLTSPTCTDCRRCEIECPEHIGILTIARDAQAQLRMINAARAEAST